MTCESPSDLTRQLPDVDALVSGWDDASFLLVDNVASFFYQERAAAQEDGAMCALLSKLKSVAAAKQLGIIATKHAIFGALWVLGLG